MTDYDRGVDFCMHFVYNVQFLNKLLIGKSGVRIVSGHI